MIIRDILYLYSMETKQFLCNNDTIIFVFMRDGRGGYVLTYSDVWNHLPFDIRNYTVHGFNFNISGNYINIYVKEVY